MNGTVAIATILFKEKRKRVLKRAKIDSFDGLFVISERWKVSGFLNHAGLQ